MTTTAVCRDPIVAELHAIREQLAQRFHNDLAAYSSAADAHCRELGFHIVESLADEPSRAHVSHPVPLLENRGMPNGNLADR
ncbi:hypothetical protein [uncultured Thiodictyon sp.]|uniref:hypothetical protein n=1 Tax=uncultured Thiodictyon sp. TaxID=1846217 RepID=UPI0025F0CBD8|nr:hypothetical protein [uncultured Thiodictyon sp.]